MHTLAAAGRGHDRRAIKGGQEGELTATHGLPVAQVAAVRPNGQPGLQAGCQQSHPESALRHVRQDPEHARNSLAPGERD